MRIVVSGGAGFIGSALVPKLLKLGHQVIVFDTLWFGDHSEPHPGLSVVTGDIRDIVATDLICVDAVINLASVANDASAELDPRLSLQVNCIGTQRIAAAAARAKVKQFLHASSGSVYGISDAPEVTEEHPLKPISVYNETKMISETIISRYGLDTNLDVQIVRAGTACGWSRRPRLDLLVNMFAMQALAKGEITVHGGSQQRPHVHVNDLADAYIWLLDHPGQRRGDGIGRFTPQIFNVAFENQSVMETAMLVKRAIGNDIEITVEPSNDARSYRLTSSKLLATGFAPKRTVVNAVDMIAAKWRSGELVDHPKHYNISWMRRLGVTPGTPLP